MVSLSKTARSRSPKRLSRPATRPASPRREVHDVDEEEVVVGDPGVVGRQVRHEVVVHVEVDVELVLAGRGADRGVGGDAEVHGLVVDRDVALVDGGADRVAMSAIRSFSGFTHRSVTSSVHVGAWSLTAWSSKPAAIDRMRSARRTSLVERGRARSA